jgi:hypothetical protein
MTRTPPPPFLYAVGDAATVPPWEGTMQRLPTFLGVVGDDADSVVRYLILSY